MIINWFLATTTEEVGVSWFDFYSIGHVCFGLGVFLFFSFLYTIPKQRGNDPLVPLWLVFVFAIVILIGWEFLENIIFIEMGIKFEGRLDSAQNIATDLILGTIGALLNLYAAKDIIDKNKDLKGYYITGIVAFSIWLLVFIILRYVTFWNSPIFVS